MALVKITPNAGLVRDALDNAPPETTGWPLDGTYFDGVSSVAVGFINEDYDTPYYTFNKQKVSYGIDLGSIQNVTHLKLWDINDDKVGELTSGELIIMGGNDNSSWTQVGTELHVVNGGLARTGNEVTTITLSDAGQSYRYWRIYISVAMAAEAYALSWAEIEAFVDEVEVSPSPSPEPEASPSPDVAPTIVETAHAKLVALADAQVGTGLPSPLMTVYSYHHVANLLLDGLTVEPESNTPVSADGAIYENEVLDNHEITFTLRIHTGYSGGVRDVTGTIELMDTLITALRQNLNLGDGYRLMNYTAPEYRQEFDESRTTGAQLTITIHKVEQYVQED